MFSTSFVFACFSLIERLTVAGLPNFQDREVAFKLLEICTVPLLVKFGKGEFVLGGNIWVTFIKYRCAIGGDLRDGWWRIFCECLRYNKFFYG